MARKRNVREPRLDTKNMRLRFTMHSSQGGHHRSQAQVQVQVQAGTRNFYPLYPLPPFSTKACSWLLPPSRCLYGQMARQADERAGY